MEEDIKKSISQGSAFISSAQNSDGSFFSLSSPNKDFKDSLVFPSIFSTTLILQSICRINDPKLYNVSKKCVAFLLSQRSNSWSFNYWVKNSKEHKDIPYPDDLDDTFCAISALYMFDKKLIDGNVLAKLTSLLTTLEVEEGGPYRTWLVSENAKEGWLDTDFVVNANIAYFLSEIDVSLPKQIRFLESCIVNDKISSPYYPTNFPGIYFLSRFYIGPLRQKLVRRLMRSSYENSLEAALIALSLLNFGESTSVVADHISYILKNQKKGHWVSHPFYTGVNPERDRNYYAGCESLTTTLCLEALNMFQQKTLEKSVQVDIAKAKIDLDRKIIGRVKKRFLYTGRCLQDDAIEVIDKIKSGDNAYQITLTPYYLKLALGKKGEKISEEFLISLGCASLYGWIAYTIYDDFYDEEGDPKLLSVANVALRTLTEIIGLSTYSKKIIDLVDSANSWELKNARPKFEKGILLKDVSLPNDKNYKYLVNKSFAHSLGSAAIFFSLGYDENSNELKDLEKFFRSYIIAKQLNDDAHDWQEDFKAGHTTPVIVKLIKKLLEKEPNYVISSNQALLDSLQEIFWFEVILDVCEEILVHVDRAKKSVESIRIIEKPIFLLNFLKGVEEGALKALREQKQTVEFLNTYV